MLSSTTNLKSNRRGGASIALLAALLSLAGGTQALAPAPAAAMIDLGEECGGTVTLDPSFCDENGGGGQGGQTPYEQPGEVIVVTDSSSKGFCAKSQNCLANETGGGRQARADGSRGPFRSRYGARPTRVAEVPLTRDECVALKRGWTGYGLKPGSVLLGSDAVANRAYEEYEQITTRMFLVNQVLERLEKRSEGLKTRLKYLRSIANPSMHDKSEILELEGTLETQQQNQIEPLKQQLDALDRSRRARDQALTRLAAANEIAHKTLRGECERQYPKLFAK